MKKHQKQHPVLTDTVMGKSTTELGTSSQSVASISSSRCVMTTSSVLSLPYDPESYSTDAYDPSRPSMFELDALSSCSELLIEKNGNPVSTAVLTQAAYAVLDQHHCYSEDQLIRYLREKYPEVPSEERRALVVGVVAGAKRATRMQVLADSCTNASDFSTRAIAADATKALGLWLFGFRSQSRLDTGFDNEQQ
jgi:hypothetical protein